MMKFYAGMGCLSGLVYLCRIRPGPVLKPYNPQPYPPPQAPGKNGLVASVSVLFLARDSIQWPVNSLQRLSLALVDRNLHNSTALTPEAQYSCMNGTNISSFYQTTFRKK